MGMSASQARYLQLTARKSDLEFQAQQICHQRLSLAEKTEYIATAYSNALNDRHLYFNVPYTPSNAIDENGEARSLVNSQTTSASSKRLDYYDITNDMLDETQPGLGYRLVDADGKIVVPAIPEGANPDDYVVDASIVPNSNDSENSYKNACDYLESKLTNGEWFLQKPVAYGEDGNEDGWVDVNYLNNSFIDYKLYMDNDSAATAKYKSSTENVQRQDKMLEMQLKQIETEQGAIKTEMESVEKVIQKNIETSFKTFG